MIGSLINYTDIEVNPMCEADAYIVQGDKERLLMKSVDKVEPEDGGLRLVNIFGEQKFIQANIHTLALVEHKILLKPQPNRVA
jgi:predicted RNA-binding protein